MVGSYAPGSDFRARGHRSSVWIDQGLPLHVRFPHIRQDTRAEVGFFIGEGASVIFVEQAGEPSRLVRRD